MAIIELNKVVFENRNHKYNLHSILNTIENNLKKFDKDVSREDILALRNQLSDTGEIALEKIKRLSDKLYAHSDESDSGFVNDNSLSFDEIGNVLSTIKTVTGLIYQKIRRVDFHWDVGGETMIAKRHMRRMLDLKEFEINRRDQIVDSLNQTKRIQ